MKEEVNHISISDYTYDLPDHRIASHPLASRDESKLLVYRNGQTEDHLFRNVPDFLPNDSVIIRNDTKVIQARIEFVKDSGGKIEIFCLEPAIPAVYESNLAKKKSVTWFCLVGNSKKWKTGVLQKELYLDGVSLKLEAKRRGELNGKERITFSWNPSNYSFGDILDHFGKTPIPPYLNRDSEPDDKIRYQTIYARFQGSVAAPTAGLHFSSEIEKKLLDKKICTTHLTLHVGAGTFVPVKSNAIKDHRMHREHVVFTRDLLHDILNNDKFGITAVGTTTLRTLESLYWLGYLLHAKKKNLQESIHIDQWLPYQVESKLTRRQALLEILLRMANLEIETISFDTSLIIVPGYEIKIADRLITNFHQPGSTLLLLVAAFVGDDWKKIYQHALDNSYRFLSYGDSSLLFRKN